MNISKIGLILFIFGLLISLIGVLIWLAPKVPILRDFPGTLKWEFRSITCVFPLLASVILSVVLSLLLNLVSRFFK